MVERTRRDFLFGAMAMTLHKADWTQTPRLDLAALRSRRDWQKAREQILTGMQLVMGQLPEPKKLSNEITTLSSVETSAFTQTKIKYIAEPGDLVDAYLLVPKALKRKAPAMLCLHQTIKIGKGEPVGLGGNPNLHYAKELAERGYVCIVPDYPYLGENTFDPYKHGYLSCTMKGIVNHRRAVDVLQSLAMVDKRRIGSIGHSLGGHNTLFVAAFDERIRAMVTSCGFTKASKYYNGNLKGWGGERYMPLVEKQYHNDPNQLPFDFPEILVALAPRPLFINAPLHDSNFEVSGVRDCEAVARPVYQKIFRADTHLVAMYPDAGHEFPPAIRQQAYAFLDRHLS
ncbi:MAG: alpha/beta fold hydrolase [Acidobacteria bacterium]|nr:alpha/beta fold hydrolase [Acidobacteriota bacterium]